MVDSNNLTKFISEISGAVVGEFTMDKLLDHIIHSTMKTLNAEVCSIFLEDKDEDPGYIKCVAGSGKAKSIVGVAKYKIGEGFTGEIAEKGLMYNIKSREELQHYTNWRGRHDYPQWQRGKYEFRNLLGYPLKIKDQVLGVIKVENKDLSYGKEFSKDDEYVFQTVANVVALTLENAKLHKDTKRILQYEENSIVRFIEFPEEYYQAGLSILNYFGTILQRKYPDTKSKFRIEQDGLSVTMIIYPLKGNPEVFEKALNEYGLVVTGKISPEEYTDDKLLLIDLKHELRSAFVRIESQRELLEYQDKQITKKDKQIDGFLNVVGAAFKNSEQSQFNINLSPNITVSPIIKTSITTKFLLSHNIAIIQGRLNEVKEHLKKISEDVEMIEEIQNGLNELEQSNSEEDVKKSSIMSKLRRLIEEVDKAESVFGKTIATIKEGLSIVQDLAKNYNSIAQWCGLPSIPIPCLKGKRER